MAAAYRVVVADREELSQVSVICGECDSEVIIDAAKAKVPEICPSCGLDYGENVKTSLAALGRFHRSASAAEEHAGKTLFRFTIRQAD